MSAHIRRAALAALVAAKLAAPVFAQPSNLSGTWKLDAGRSTISAEAGLAALIAKGAPERLHVTQPANGTLIIESEINEGHARIYTPRAKSTTPVSFQGGTIMMTSRWDGRTLVSEGTQEWPSGTSTLAKQVKEVIGLAAGGRTLSIEVTTTGPSGEKNVSTLLYVRTQEVGPCQTWSTPCKGRK